MSELAKVPGREDTTLMQTVDGKAAEAYLLGTIRHAIDKWVPDSEKVQVNAAMRELYLCLGKMERAAMMEHRRGFNEVLDALGAPDKEAAPMERLLRLQVLLGEMVQ